MRSAQNAPKQGKISSFLLVLSQKKEARIECQKKRNSPNTQNVRGNPLRFTFISNCTPNPRIISWISHVVQQLPEASNATEYIININASIRASTNTHLDYSAHASKPRHETHITSSTALIKDYSHSKLFLRLCHRARVFWASLWPSGSPFITWLFCRC